MKCEAKKLEKSQTELTITVAPEEYQKFLERAAQDISEHTTIKGFRPGHAPYEHVKNTVGEEKIYEHALEYIVRRFYSDAVTEQKLDPIGMPKIELAKLAPGNEIVFKATVAILPDVKLADIASIKVEPREKTITDTDVDRVLEDVRKMRASEVIKSGVATNQDKVVVDMDMLKDGVPLEGGQARNHSVYLSEEYYIPGLQKELVGLKKDDEKEFKLTMPANHYQKHMAGRELSFKVKVKDVFERQLPELNDEFAKGLGQDTVAGLRVLINENLTAEAKQKEEQRVEIALFDQLIDGSTLGEIPDVMIEAEKDKMWFEMKRGAEQQGMVWEEYLKSIEKTEPELRAAFTEQATRRAKAALVSRALAKEQNLAPTGAEIDEEIAHIREAYKDNAQAQENLDRPEIRDTVATLIRNRKVIAWLKGHVLWIST